MAAGSDDEDIGAEENGMNLDFLQVEIEEHDIATASTGRSKTSDK